MISVIMLLLGLGFMLTFMLIVVRIGMCVYSRIWRWGTSRVVARVPGVVLGVRKEDLGFKGVVWCVEQCVCSSGVDG